MSIQTSSTSQAHRLPAPTLFVAPPSRNASTTDLRSPPTIQPSSSNRVALLRQRSARPNPPRQTTQRPSSPSTPVAEPKDSPIEPTTSHHTGPIPLRRHQPAAAAAAAHSDPREHDDAAAADAAWAEMQQTLDEVELAGSVGANVFGAAHADALAELRAAQIALAQAWARSEEGVGVGDGLEVQAGDGDGEVGEGAVLSGGGSGERRASLVGRRGAEAEQGGQGMAGRGTGRSGGRTALEEETENDILLARRRRLANDRYFERVARGVVDVVGRLEEVAKRMGGVEMESKEIWGERDSLSSAS